MSKMFSLGGSTARTDAFLTRMQNPNELYSSLAGFAQRGVNALQAATPLDSSLTAYSWSYEIEISGDKCAISWLNSNVAGDTHVVILLQYGHGTGTGGYVPGRDFINPALQPIFDEIADSVWKKVSSV